jgi:5-methyltetrahydrofolate--homocysteine methyltransferase
MEKTVRFLEKAGLRDSVKIMVGGAPVTEEFAQKIGADGYGHDAVEAVDLAKEWLQV